MLGVSCQLVHTAPSLSVLLLITAVDVSAVIILPFNFLLAEKNLGYKIWLDKYLKTTFVPSIRKKPAYQLVIVLFLNTLWQKQINEGQWHR